MEYREALITEYFRAIERLCVTAMDVLGYTLDDVRAGALYLAQHEGVWAVRRIELRRAEHGMPEVGTYDRNPVVGTVTLGGVRPPAHPTGDMGRTMGDGPGDEEWHHDVLLRYEPWFTALAAPRDGAV